MNVFTYCYLLIITLLLFSCSSQENNKGKNASVSISKDTLISDNVNDSRKLVVSSDTLITYDHLDTLPQSLMIKTVIIDSNFNFSIDTIPYKNTNIRRMYLDRNTNELLRVFIDKPSNKSDSLIASLRNYPYYEKGILRENGQRLLIPKKHYIVEFYSDLVYLSKTLISDNYGHVEEYTKQLIANTALKRLERDTIETGEGGGWIYESPSTYSAAMGEDYDRISRYKDKKAVIMYNKDKKFHLELLDRINEKSIAKHPLNYPVYNINHGRIIKSTTLTEQILITTSGIYFKPDYKHFISVFDVKGKLKWEKLQNGYIQHSHNGSHLPASILLDDRNQQLYTISDHVSKKNIRTTYIHCYKLSNGSLKWSLPILKIYGVEPYFVGRTHMIPYVTDLIVTDNGYLALTVGKGNYKFDKVSGRQIETWTDNKLYLIDKDGRTFQIASLHDTTKQTILRDLPGKGLEIIMDKNRYIFR